MGDVWIGVIVFLGRDGRVSKRQYLMSGSWERVGQDTYSEVVDFLHLGTGMTAT